MKGLEEEFLQSIKAVDMLAPKDVSVIENETLPAKHVQYRINLNGVEYRITVKKNEGCVLTLGDGNEEVGGITDGELLYRELKQKARTWYWDEELSKYTVVFNNTRCKVCLDIYSWIPPFVLKPLENTDTRFIGLDFLTVYSLISKE